MTIVNLYGGPGAGKSTIAAALFAYMKQQGYTVELVTEYAKDLVWEGRREILSKQDYLFAKQHRRLNRLDGKVNYVITDSPLLLNIIYQPVGYFKSFSQFVAEVNCTYNNFNIFVNRTVPYESIGRLQDSSGADDLAQRVKETLIDLGEAFIEVNSTIGVDQLLRMIVNDE